jgi:GT2 family glycosyltransferase
MPKVTIIQQVYNSRRFIPQVYGALVGQTFKDIQIISQIVVDDGGCKDYIREHYPQVKIVEPGYNIGFARGHNEIFAYADTDIFQLVNPDLILTPTFVEEIVKVFEVPHVGSASGKLLRYDFANNRPTKFIDAAGVAIAKSGRGWARGQHQEDRGQFDRDDLAILGPDGAAAAYRKAALESVKYPLADGRYEYFDESFHSYWEDVDLDWRLVNAGWKSRFVPKAVAYHGRTASSSPSGYKKVFAFIKHHKAILPRIRRLNYKNHIYMFIKNAPRWYWQFFAREFFYHIYVLLVEPGTFKIWPEFWRGLKPMFAKRKFIRSQRKITAEEAEKIFG